MLENYGKLLAAKTEDDSLQTARQNQRNKESLKSG